MRRSTLIALGAAALAAGWLGLAGPAPAEETTPPEKKFEDFDKLTRGAKELDGLFRLHQKDEHVYAEIRPDQFGKMFLCPIAIARGAGMGGDTLNFGDQWVLFFRRVGDKVHLLRRNVHFKARKDLPVARAVETTYTDSVLLALKIHSINQARQAVLIDLNDIFMSNFAEVPLGGFDSARSTWEKVKAFPRNIELEVAATFSGGRLAGSDDVIDSRGTTVMIHYGLAQLPDDDGYQPRLADDRVGHFLSVVKDFSSDGRDTTFVRYVNRWRLERAENDPKNPDKLSPPRKKIVFWIEKSVPDEYRAYVREGILEWNKAFAQVGFRDAIEVRQQENEDFDPEDINYNTFRWITTDRGFAMGPSRANPLTGEILDADILFDASMVTAWKRQYQLSRSGGGATAYDEPVSLIQAAHRGWGLGAALAQPEPPAGWDGPRQRELDDPAAEERLAQRWAVRQGVCQCGACMSYELGLAAMVLAARGETPSADKVPEELIGQAIKEVTMHEVGHTLGLRHNFKASTMLKNEQLHDTAITHKLGLVGSVMDYSPINLAPKGVKQGDYFTTILGPYDYWAIAYAYKPLIGGTEGEYEKLEELASHSAEPGHDYSTDEDLYSSSDPLVNLFDLGADPMKFAQDRMALAEDLFKDLAEKGAEKGEGYQRLRQAFNLLLGQYGNGAYLIARNIGGEYMHRDHSGDPAGRDPFVPVPAAKQREALKFLQDHILSDRTFQFAPQLLRRLAADRWMHWGTEGRFGSVEYPLNERILSIQRIVLDHALDGQVLRRIQNNALKADKEEQPLTVAEVFRSLTDGIWSDTPAAAPVPAKDAKDVRPAAPQTSVVRRNLQREYVKDLASLVAGSRSGGDAVPADARSLARMHLREIQKRIEAQLKNDKAPLDDTTRAHLEECQERIAKVLAASVRVNEP